MTQCFKIFRRSAILNLNGTCKGDRRLEQEPAGDRQRDTNYSRSARSKTVWLPFRARTAKSMPEAIEIQTNYAKLAYESYIQQLLEVLPV